MTKRERAIIDAAEKLCYLRALRVPDDSYADSIEAALKELEQVVGVRDPYGRRWLDTKPWPEGDEEEEPTPRAEGGGLVVERPWLAKWFQSWDTGTSSETIAHFMLGTLWTVRYPDAPYDTSDVGRCIGLLDLATANGEDWRAALPELAKRVPAWAPLVPIWADVEAAYREDEAAQRAVPTTGPRGGRLKTGPKYPPSRCWWLVSTARGHGDPYKTCKPHPFARGPA